MHLNKMNAFVIVVGEEYDFTWISREYNKTREYINGYEEADFQSSSQVVSSKNSVKQNTDKRKKKTPWYSALYPSYKTRNEDFKKIFRDLAAEERLIVDYSCAIQRDILIHGRLYASQNLLCFYANIFRWETQVTVQWKDITSITKEKTALVIPNAILIQTTTEKHFFTSFTTRDKTHLMLFRIWQQSLMHQPMTIQDIWHWVHVCYGDELGITSDDEDYIPSLGDKSTSKLRSESIFEESSGLVRKSVGAESRPAVTVTSHSLASTMAAPDPATTDRAQQPSISDSTDTSESEEDKKPTSSEITVSAPARPVSCPVSHDGRRLLLTQVYPRSVDQLFTLIFTHNKFNSNLMESLKYSDINISNWEDNSTTGLKTRTTHLVVPVTQPVGPKTCTVSETQVLQGCSKPGQLYVVEVEAVNSGVPYCDSFYLATHFCLTYVSSSEAACSVYSQIKYRKSVWGIVKTFIEKNVWAGMDDYFRTLSKALEEECSKAPGGSEGNGGGELVRSPKRESTRVTTTAPQPVSAPPATHAHVASPAILTADNVLWVILGVLGLLLVLNIVLYYKLSIIEDTDRQSRILSAVDSQILKEERSHEQWVALIQKQAKQHHREMQHWQNLLKGVVSHLRQAEESINNLRNSLYSPVSGKILAAVNSVSDKDDSLSNEHNEL